MSEIAPDETDETDEMDEGALLIADLSDVVAGTTGTLPAVDVGGLIALGLLAAHPDLSVEQAIDEAMLLVRNTAKGVIVKLMDLSGDSD